MIYNYIETNVLVKFFDKCNKKLIYLLSFLLKKEKNISIYILISYSILYISIFIVYSFIKSVPSNQSILHFINTYFNP